MSHIDDMNYYNDPRTQSAAEAPVLYTTDEEGNDIEAKLPTKMEVCPVCDGHGKHVNPSIDSGGLSAEDFDEDPEFAEDYMRGTYDVTCNRCGGNNVVPVVDWESVARQKRTLCA